MRKKDDPTMCYDVPISAYYETQPDGTLKMIREKSEFADIPGDFIARFLIRQFGKDIPGIKG